MAWSQDTGKRTKHQWQSRFAKERLNLSASVEEALAEPSIQEELLSEEPDDAGEPSSRPHNTTIIPPKLSLQSKSMPAVQVEPAKPAQAVVVDTAPALHTRPVETPTKGQKKHRLAGRTTKVRLQAVPKTEKKPGAKVQPETVDLDHQQPAIDGHRTKAGSDAQPYTEPIAMAGMERDASTITRGRLSGSGVFEQGQEEITVMNAIISSSSVVIVTLINDPGPVVVHYVTLQPLTGFTIHLSAPAMKKTSFNYVILMMELF
jgi:hypothetical protein